MNNAEMIKKTADKMKNNLDDHRRSGLRSRESQNRGASCRKVSGKPEKARHGHNRDEEKEKRCLITVLAA